MGATKTSTAHASRGGAQRRARFTRTDRDGDLVMTGATPTKSSKVSKPRAPRNGSHNRTSPPSGPSGGSRRGPPAGGSININSTNVQRQLAQRNNTNAKSNRSHRSTGPNNKNSDFKRIRVTGLDKSKAATNSDGGVSALVGFLEKKASIQYDKAPAEEKSGKRIKITKHYRDHESIVISVHRDMQEFFLRVNSFSFAGIPLEITAVDQPEPQKATESEKPNEVRSLLKSVLSRRYNVDAKLLDLSALGQDPDLVAVGMFNAASSQSKFFPAMMKICDEVFESTQHKREMVLSVTLSRNDLTSLAPVTTLAQTFPDIKNLDLSCNQLPTLHSLDPWRRKFRHLEHLVLSDNPFEQTTERYDIEVAKWYPKLRFLNGIEIRSEQEVSQKSTTNGDVSMVSEMDTTANTETSTSNLTILDGLTPQQQDAVSQLSQATNMTAEYSKMCLDQAGWDLEAAYATFEKARPTLGPEAFFAL